MEEDMKKKNRKHDEDEREQQPQDAENAENTEETGEETAQPLESVTDLMPLLAALLPILDNLERAVAIETADEKLHTGVDMVLKQMVDMLEKRGVTSIDRTGEPFDPKLENAVMQGTPEDGEKGTVCQVLQKGYQMGTHVLRTAMVKVVPE